MKVTKKFLGSYGWINFEIVEKTQVCKTIEHYIPYKTGWNAVKGVFPSYLNGFESYYEPEPESNLWKLKDEYWDNRPKYSTEVVYYEYEVEMNKKVKKEIKRRFERYSKLANKYEKLLELI